MAIGAFSPIDSYSKLGVPICEKASPDSLTFMCRHCTQKIPKVFWTSLEVVLHQRWPWIWMDLTLFTQHEHSIGAKPCSLGQINLGVYQHASSYSSSLTLRQSWLSKRVHNCWPHLVSVGPGADWEAPSEIRRLCMHCKNRWLPASQPHFINQPAARASSAFGEPVVTQPLATWAGQFFAQASL